MIGLAIAAVVQRRAIPCLRLPSRRSRIFSFLRMEKCLSVPTIRGYRSTLSAVFKFCLPGLQDHFVLCDLIRYFKLERPLRPVSPPAWDLVKVLSFLHGFTFEPLSSHPLRVVTMKTFSAFFGYCQGCGRFRLSPSGLPFRETTFLYHICLSSSQRPSRNATLSLGLSSFGLCPSLWGTYPRSVCCVW